MKNKKPAKVENPSVNKLAMGCVTLILIFLVTLQIVISFLLDLF